jgi:hypothetical protein
MRTAREQREANTVHTSKAQANLEPRLQPWHALQAIERIERNDPWSQPICAAMSFRLGISYAQGNGQVPV